jgi:hypothetical protein
MWIVFLAILLCTKAGPPTAGSARSLRRGTSRKKKLEFEDARKGIYILDVTDAEAEELGQKGRKQARRGRRPKAAA